MIDLISGGLGLGIRDLANPVRHWQWLTFQASGFCIHNSFYYGPVSGRELVAAQLFG